MSYQIDGKNMSAVVLITGQALFIVSNFWVVHYVAYIKA